MPDRLSLSEALTSEDCRRRDAWLADFRASWSPRRLAEMWSRLPPPGQPLRLVLLAEMVEIDMERQRGLGRQPRLEDYLHFYPELKAPDVLRYLTPSANTPPPSLESLGNLGSLGGVSSSAPSASSAGMMFGKYRLKRVLGKGGMGEVWLATDTTLNRAVAIKRPLHTDPTQLKRLRREAEAVARLDEHPGICRIHEIGEINGQFYLALAYVKGRTLQQVLAGGTPLTPRVAAKLVRRLAATLEFAHANGVIHRDLKPANIMIRQRAVPVVMDFGLAGEMDGDHSLTPAEAVVGTPHYMPPEQARGEVHTMGPLWDVYSLGIILYEMLARQRAFVGSNAMAILYQVQNHAPPKPSTLNAAVALELEAICLKAMAREPAARYASMAEFERALTEYLKGSRSASGPLAPPPPVTQVRPAAKARNRTWAYVALVLVMPLLLGGLAWLLASAARPPHDPSPTASAVDGAAKIKTASGIDLVPLPAGWFLMGSADDDGRAWSDERPRHKVVLSKPFALGKCEVTVGQFRRFAEAENYKTDAERAGASATWRHPGFEQSDDHPVVCVSWYDACTYCRWLGRATGERVRLPREAEWEYACRGRPTQAIYATFPYGDEAAHLGDYAWYAVNAGSRTNPVGRKKANDAGLHDMLGNVWEWCADAKRTYRNADEEDSQGDDTDAADSPSGAPRAIRGGSFANAVRNCRVANRDSLAPSEGCDYVGFRVLTLFRTSH